MSEAGSGRERVRLRVRGRVQGVGFRAFVVREARRRRLDGYTRNLPDGSVEVVAEGSPAALRELLGAVRQGPPAASVSEVERLPEPPAGDLHGFEIRY